MNADIASYARRILFASLALGAILVAPLASSAQDATPSMVPMAHSCAGTAIPTAPGMMGDHSSMDDDMIGAEEIEFDQLYIDMMLPHHGSVIALAEAALPHLTHPDLIDMANAIIANQTAENAMLTEWRMDWYGDAEPDMSNGSMMQMMDSMPMGDMESMMQQMDPIWQVETFCAAENPDLAFIMQVIPHHQMAVDASRVAIDQSVHPELAAFAAQVIVDQQAEIDQLTSILAEMEEATPEA